MAEDDICLLSKAISPPVPDLTSGPDPGSPTAPSLITAPTLAPCPAPIPAPVYALAHNTDHDDTFSPPAPPPSIPAPASPQSLASAPISGPDPVRPRACKRAHAPLPPVSVPLLPPPPVIDSSPAPSPTPAPAPAPDLGPAISPASAPASPTSASPPSPGPAPVHNPTPNQVSAPASAPATDTASAPTPCLAPAAAPAPYSLATIPAPRTSFVSQRNRMGLKVDVESARRKSLSEASAERWDTSALGSEAISSEEDVMTECIDDDCDDDWNMEARREDNDTGTQAVSMPQEDGEKEMESFAFDDEIEFLAHLETVSDHGSDDEGEHPHRSYLDDDYDDDDEMCEAVYEADFRVDERFFLHTIHEDSVEKEEDEDSTEDCLASGRRRASSNPFGEVDNCGNLADLEAIASVPSGEAVSSREPHGANEDEAMVTSILPPQSDSPFHRGGLDRSTIRAKRGQRRTADLLGQQSVDQPQQGQKEEEDESADLEEPAPALRKSADRKRPRPSTMRKLEDNHGEKTREQTEDMLSARQTSLQVDIKTWEERKAEKFKNLPMKCVFSAEI